MVGRITKGASIRGVLEYNAGKVLNGEAFVLYGNLVLGDCEQSDTFDMRRALLSFQPYLDTRKIKDPVFHVSLNPDITDCLTDAQLTEIAREYMERMGFGDQPYYVFKPRDIDRDPIHIVSVRLRDDGSIITDSQDRPRSKAILQSIEHRYGLRPAVKGDEQREFDTARRVEYGRDNLKQQMKSAVRLLAEQYRFGSITEYRTLLNLYNVDLEERKGEADGKRWNGIVYTATDEQGKWVGTPIKSSALTPKGGYKFLQKHLPVFLKTIVVPLLTMLITVPVTLIVLGPIGNTVGTWLANGVYALYQAVPALAVMVIGITTPLMVFFGMNNATYPVVFALMAAVNSDPLICTGMAPANVAVGGACLAASLLSKNVEEKSVSVSAGITALCGITEPGVYGVLFPKTYPLIGAMIGGGIGGLLAGILGMTQYVISTPGFISLPAYIDPTGSSYNLIVSVIVMIVAVVLGFVATYALGKRAEAKK